MDPNKQVSIVAQTLTSILAVLMRVFFRETLPLWAAKLQVAALSLETPEPGQPARRAVQLARCQRSKEISIFNLWLF